MSHNTRFDWILEGKSNGSNPIFDSDLKLDPNFICLPTKGSIVSNWLLAIPKIKALSLSKLEGQERNNLLNCVSTIKEIFDYSNSQVFIFEHGAIYEKSLVGCGVDQAHLHVAPLKFDLISLVLNTNDGMRWEKISSSDPWHNIKDSHAYYMISNGIETYRAYPQKQYSQYFRRHIASAVGEPNKWDYNLFPYEENAKETVENIVGKKAKQAA